MYIRIINCWLLAGCVETELLTPFYMWERKLKLVEWPSHSQGLTNNRAEAETQFPPRVSQRGPCMDQVTRRHPASLQEGARSAASAPWWPNQQAAGSQPPQPQIYPASQPPAGSFSAALLPLSPAGLICKAMITAPYQNIFTSWGSQPSQQNSNFL